MKNSSLEHTLMLIFNRAVNRTVLCNALCYLWLISHMTAPHDSRASSFSKRLRVRCPHCDAKMTFSTVSPVESVSKTPSFPSPKTASQCGRMPNGEKKLSVGVSILPLSQTLLSNCRSPPSWVSSAAVCSHICSQKGNVF